MQHTVCGMEVAVIVLVFSVIIIVVSHSGSRVALNV